MSDSPSFPTATRLDKTDPTPPQVVDEGDSGSEDFVFDDLVADLAKPVEVQEVLYSLPHRPGWHMRFRHIADYSEIERATKAGDRTRRRANSRPGEVDMDGLRIASILLSTHNTGIIRNGRVWTKDGNAVTVTSKAFIDTMAAAAKKHGKPVVNSSASALCMAYGWDADVMNHGNRLQADSGWSSSASDDEDPTLVA